ncbi:hypothetical protein B0O80DRAFT_459417 [Mortierella sp. GBAus27b]|nr:hypothetical protein BGX31_010172 [Mortierella sp. GBA43]KAI8349836.1 hypothetical protein B0O80DRAFT_459417 [Mortierella sp. GBAus27b]
MAIFTEEEIQEVTELFKQSDANGDGLLNFQELRVLIKEYDSSVSDEQIKTVIEDHDTDKDGCLNFNEFKAVLATLRDME